MERSRDLFIVSSSGARPGGGPSWLSLPPVSGDPSPGGSRPNRTADVGPGWARPERTVHPQSRGAHPQGQCRARLSLPGRTSASPTGASPNQDLSHLASPPPRQHNGEQEVTAWVPSRPMLGDDSETPRLLAPSGAWRAVCPRCLVPPHAHPCSGDSVMPRSLPPHLHCSLGSDTPQGACGPGRETRWREVQTQRKWAPRPALH